MNNNFLKNSRTTPFFLAAISSMAACFIIGFLLKKTDFFNDINNFYYTNIQLIRTPFWNTFFIRISLMGGGIFISLSCALISMWLIYKRHFLVIVHLYANLGIARGVLNHLKNWFGIVRPPTAGADAGFSFPSSHATIAFTFFIFIAWLFTNAYNTSFKRTMLFCACCIPAMLVGFSRLYLGVHWLTDVLGGVLLATAINCLSIGIYRTYNNNPIMVDKWSCVFFLIFEIVLVSVVK